MNEFIDEPTVWERFKKWLKDALMLLAILLVLLGWGFSFFLLYALRGGCDVFVSNQDAVTDVITESWDKAKESEDEGFSIKISSK